MIQKTVNINLGADVTGEGSTGLVELDTTFTVKSINRTTGDVELAYQVADEKELEEMYAQARKDISELKAANAAKGE